MSNTSTGRSLTVDGRIATLTFKRARPAFSSRTPCANWHGGAIYSDSARL